MSKLDKTLDAVDTEVNQLLDHFLFIMIYSSRGGDSPG
jgi:hypothetical protein